MTKKVKISLSIELTLNGFKTISKSFESPSQSESIITHQNILIAAESSIIQSFVKLGRDIYFQIAVAITPGCTDDFVIIIIILA